MALIVQVPVLPDVAKEPAAATGAGLAANARVGGSTSWYCTWNAVRGPLLRAVIVNVPVEPTIVSGVRVLYNLVTPKSASKGVSPLGLPPPAPNAKSPKLGMLTALPATYRIV